MWAHRATASGPHRCQWQIEVHLVQPLLPAEDEHERLRREFSVLGFLCDRHPMTLFADKLQNRRTIKAADLPRFVGRKVCLAGWLITGKVVSTKTGDPMEFLTFEDETGLVETAFFLVDGA